MYMYIYTYAYIHTYIYMFSSVQSLSRVRLFATPWITARQASLSITISRSSLKLTSIESVMPSSHLILCHPLFLLPQIPRHHICCPHFLFLFLLSLLLWFYIFSFLFFFLAGGRCREEWMGKEARKLLPAIKVLAIVFRCLFIDWHYSYSVFK